jgi:hypothetical protein
LVTLELRPDKKGVYHFYLKNASSDYVSEIQIINEGLKCKYTDHTRKSEDGTSEYLLYFPTKPSLAGNEEVEITPKLKFFKLGSCDADNTLIKPINFSKLEKVTILYKDKDGNGAKTDLALSWSGQCNVLTKKNSILKWLCKLPLKMKILLGIVLLTLIFIPTDIDWHKVFSIRYWSEKYSFFPFQDANPIECPKTMSEIVELRDKCLWEGTIFCGDREVYNNLLRCSLEENNVEIKSQIMRIEEDYKTSILVKKVNNIGSVCQQHTMKGDKCVPEPIQQFNARNVVNHLDIQQYPRCTSRARALSILRNLDTAPDIKDIDQKELIERLIFIIQNDPSLLVSKLALDRYCELTGYKKQRVFDFDGALKHYESSQQPY